MVSNPDTLEPIFNLSLNLAKQVLFLITTIFPFHKNKPLE